MPLPQRATAVLVALVGLSLSTLAHDDDPKLLSRVPPIPGPGVHTGTPDVAVPGARGAQLPSFGGPGITLLAWLSLGDFGNGTSGNDCWGYVSPSGREYALMGLSQRRRLRRRHGAGRSADRRGRRRAEQPVARHQDLRPLRLRGQRGRRRHPGLRPGADRLRRRELRSATSPTAAAPATHNVAIDTDSGFLYRCGGGNNGLRIYDLNADPTNPPLVGPWQSRYVHDTEVVTYTSGPAAGKQVAFCCAASTAARSSTGLTIIDVTNKSNTAGQNELFWPNAGYSHQCWLSDDRALPVRQRRARRERHHAPHHDLRRSTSRTRSRRLPGRHLHQRQHVDRPQPLRARQPDLRGQLPQRPARVRRLVEPHRPTEVASFDTYAGDDNATFNGLWSCYPYFPERRRDRQRPRARAVRVVGRRPADRPSTRPRGCRI